MRRAAERAESDASYRPVLLLQAQRSCNLLALQSHRDTVHLDRKTMRMMGALVINLFQAMQSIVSSYLDGKNDEISAHENVTEKKNLRDGELTHRA